MRRGYAMRRSGAMRCEPPSKARRHSGVESGPDRGTSNLRFAAGAGPVGKRVQHSLRLAAGGANYARRYGLAPNRIQCQPHGYGNRHPSRSAVRSDPHRGRTGAIVQTYRKGTPGRWSKKHWTPYAPSWNRLRALQPSRFATRLRLAMPAPRTICSVTSGSAYNGYPDSAAGLREPASRGWNRASVGTWPVWKHDRAFRRPTWVDGVHRERPRSHGCRKSAYASAYAAAFGSSYEDGPLSIMRVK